MEGETGPDDAGVIGDSDQTVRRDADLNADKSASRAWERLCLPGRSTGA